MTQAPDYTTRDWKISLLAVWAIAFWPVAQLTLQCIKCRAHSRKLTRARYTVRSEFTVCERDVAVFQNFWAVESEFILLVLVCCR